ncbi:MAG: hypothetical protein J0I12_06790 [Candidatus Eremiobacteraeota bacterium]|nr:hypothetical protein [Candidatus Eremiobacteraeota bacterium]
MPNLVAVLTLKMEKDWLCLDRRTRQSYRTELDEIIAQHPRVLWRYCDSEALSGKYQDFVLIEFSDILDYHNLWESLRDHPVFSKPHFSVVSVQLGVERPPLTEEAP